MRGESGYFFTPSGIVVLNTPTLELYMALSVFFFRWDFGCAWALQGRLLCCQWLSMSDSRNKGFFQVFSWCWLDFMAAISPSVGKPPLCSHFRRIGNSSSTWKKESFIFYWNQLHWTFYQVLSGFSFHTSNALFCLHFEIFGCCFNPLIYLPGSAWWGWRLLARKAKRQKVGPSWAETWDCTYRKYPSLSVFIPCPLSDACQEGKAAFPAQWNALYHLLVSLATSPLYCLLLRKPWACFWGDEAEDWTKMCPSVPRKTGLT